MVCNCFAVGKDYGLERLAKGKDLLFFEELSGT